LSTRTYSGFDWQLSTPITASPPGLGVAVGVLVAVAVAVGVALGVLVAVAVHVDVGVLVAVAVHVEVAVAVALGVWVAVYTSDAADDRLCVDHRCRRHIKKKKKLAALT